MNGSTPTAGTVAPCRYCRQVRPLRARGLCGTCYVKPGVRAMFPAEQASGWAGEPTAEQLDRLEAEQRAKLPRWWRKEAAAENPSRADDRPPPQVARLQVARRLFRRGRA